MFNDLFNGMFGSIENGCCRLSMNGGIAVKTSNGYKTYNVKTGRLTNCNNFVLDIGQDLFFVIPTNKVHVGDIIFVNGKPKCVIKAEKNNMQVLNYEDSTVETILPERHVFMGNTYFYGKIVSMFGDSSKMKGKNGMEKILKYAIMSEVARGMSNGGNTSIGGNNSSFGSMMALSAISGGMDNMFGDMFDFGLDDDDNEDEDTDESSTDSGDDE